MGQYHRLSGPWFPYPQSIREYKAPILHATVIRTKLHRLVKGPWQTVRPRRVDGRRTLSVKRQPKGPSLAEVDAGQVEGRLAFERLLRIEYFKRDEH